ncbi:MAG: MurR/RpiR family transcriptional regulator [Erysipelotrichaceae bacterium]|nr:MurR/RpiR family transcriptional regulator [Erysipelotrichaceae bacterium]
MIFHRIETTHFSVAESEIIEYILNEGSKIRDMSSYDIAKATFTSAPLLVRIAKKLGFGGWTEFKKAYLEELEYLNRETDIDASIPFTISDDIMTICDNVARLQIAAIKETHALLSHDDIQEALRLLRDCQTIDIYATSYNHLLAQQFCVALAYLGIRVNISLTPGDDQLLAAMSDKSHCAIVISYSGETKSILNVLDILKKRQAKTIGITCMADNTLSNNVDVCLRMTSKEMISTKIGQYSTSSSLGYLLNVLYSGIFAFDYAKNLNYKMKNFRFVGFRNSGYEYIDEK